MYRTDDQVRADTLQKGNDEPGGIRSTRLQDAEHRGDDEADKKLQRKLLPAGQAQVPLVDDLDVIVGKADGTESCC